MLRLDIIENHLQVKRPLAAQDDLSVAGIDAYSKRKIILNLFLNYIDKLKFFLVIVKNEGNRVENRNLFISLHEVVSGVSVLNK